MTSEPFVERQDAADSRPGSWASREVGATWRASAQRAPGPWDTKDVARLAIVSAVGVIAVVFCWYGGSGAKTLDDQLPWLVGAIAGSGVIVSALVAWLIAGFRTVRLTEHETVRRLLPLMERLPGASAPASADDHYGTDRVAVVPGSQRYHRTDCRMIVGKAGVIFLDQEDAQTLHDLGACGICRP